LTQSYDSRLRLVGIILTQSHSSTCSTPARMHMHNSNQQSKKSKGKRKAKESTLSVNKRRTLSNMSNGEYRTPIRSMATASASDSIPRPPSALSHASLPPLFPPGTAKTSNAWRPKHVRP
jgi:hypothetical protein